jgi:cysteine desulfurase
MRESLYLDAIATTPLSEVVRQQMLPYLGERYGNPAGAHSRALDCRDAVEDARTDVRSFIGAGERASVLFTGSGTEANNLAVLGLMREKNRPGRIIISAIEHPSITGACAALQREGHEVVSLPVDSVGSVSTEALAKELQAGGADLVVSHLSNYDIGVKQDLVAIGQCCRESNAVLLVDATYGAGWNPVSMQELGVELLTLSPHRFGGPAGVGMLVLSPGIEISPLMYGGTQEYGLRPGFSAVAQMVGAGAACAEAQENGAAWAQQTEKLQRYFLNQLSKSLNGFRINGPAPGIQRDPHHISFSIEQVEGEAVLLNLDLKGVQVTSNTGCVSVSEKVSPVLLAIGVEKSLAAGTLVVGLLPEHTEEELARAVELIGLAVERVRQLFNR